MPYSGQGYLYYQFKFTNFMPSIPGVHMLKCKCDICKDKNYTCSTDGYCFTMTTKNEEGNIVYSYRYVNSIL